MTKQVRTAYRSHRKAAWVVALGLAGAVAAVVIPLASAGAARRTRSPRRRRRPCASASQHESDHQEHGNSADARLGGDLLPGRTPSHRRRRSGSCARARRAPSSGGTKDIVGLDNINLAPGASRDDHGDVQGRE